MAKNKKPNIFKRIAMRFKEVRLELKKVVWPSKEKLKQTCAVVLAVILFFAVFLSAISIGGRKLLEKVGFYEPDETTVETTTVATDVTVPETSSASTESSETSESSVETSEETAESTEA